MNLTQVLSGVTVPVSVNGVRETRNAQRGNATVAGVSSISVMPETVPKFAKIVLHSLVQLIGLYGAS